MHLVARWPDQPDKPPSPIDMTVFAAALVTLGVLGLLAAIQALAHLPLAAAAAICIVSVLAGFLIRSWLDYPARHLATAWTTGAMVGVAILLAALVIT